jgi:hypothetical protein
VPVFFPASDFGVAWSSNLMMTRELEEFRWFRFGDYTLQDKVKNFGTATIPDVTVKLGAGDAMVRGR